MMADTNNADGTTTTTSFLHHRRHHRHQMQYEIHSPDRPSLDSGIGICCSRSGGVNSSNRQSGLSPSTSTTSSKEGLTEENSPTRHHHQHQHTNHHHSHQQYNSNNRSIMPPATVSSSTTASTGLHHLLNDEQKYHHQHQTHLHHQQHEEFLDEHEAVNPHSSNSLYHSDMVASVSPNGCGGSSGSAVRNNEHSSSIISSLKDEVDVGNNKKVGRRVVTAANDENCAGVGFIDDCGPVGGGRNNCANDNINIDNDDCRDQAIDHENADVDNEMITITNGKQNHHRQEYKTSASTIARISTSPLLPPVQSYARQQNINLRSVVVSNGNHNNNGNKNNDIDNNNIGGNVSPTNWHQPQSQVDYIQHQSSLQQAGEISSTDAEGSKGEGAASASTNLVSNTDADTVAIATEMVEMHHQSHAGHVVASASGGTGVSGHLNQQTAATGAVIPTKTTTTTKQTTPPINAYGMLKHDNDLLYIRENCIEIGRNSSTSHVHFHVARNSFVSRKHFQVLYDPDTCDFYVLCLSKNGVFVDDTFQRRSPEPMKLPKSCFFRFPSTEIRIIFESFVNSTSASEPYSSVPAATTAVNSSSTQMQNPGTSASNNTTLNNSTNSNTNSSLSTSGLENIAAAAKLQYFSENASSDGGSGGGGSGSGQNVLSQQHHHHSNAAQQQQQHAANGSNNNHHNQKKSTNTSSSMESSNVIFSPLKISIPKTEQKSPYPSPTGTISAANSCPTSPRQSFQDYQGYNSYNSNASSNNNINTTTSTANNNNNNNSNNNNISNSSNSNGNIQSQELFQTPSTSSYNDHEKPPYSYAQLIVQSISAAPDKQLTLSGIYSFISKHYPYYRKEANKGWQNSIRHNLSLNRYFIKVARSQDEPGKGSFWRIDPNSEAKLIDQSYKKRRQRGSQCFRPSYGMPRSAPVSPSHIDNSRESSPLHDIVLQSAPGSPGISYQNHLDNHGSEDLMYGSHNINQQSSYSSSHSSNQYSSPYHISSSNQQSSGVVSASNTNSGGGSVAGNTQTHQQQVKVSVTSSTANSNNNNSSNCNANGGTAASALIAIKRHHQSASSGGGGQSTNNNSAGHSQHHHQQHHSDMYDETPEYTGGGDICSATGGLVGVGVESDEECEVVVKRPKYSTEINQ